MADRWQIWVDTGGTFTDCIGISPGGAVRRTKILSDSCLRGTLTEQISEGLYRFEENWGVDQNIFNGYIFRSLDDGRECRVENVDFSNGTLTLDAHLPSGTGDFEITTCEEVPVLAARILTLTSLEDPLPPMELRLGSTRGTNALLEHKGAPTTLIINRGLTDLLKIGTQQRPDIFQLDIPEKVLLHDQVIGISGRIDASGNEIEPLDETEINQIALKLKSAGVRCVAIALMHSYLNTNHERRTGEILTRHGIEYVSKSASLSPQIKILPRAETAVVNAYLSPVIIEYVQRIRERLPRPSVFKIMTSAGGLENADHFTPKDSLLSGPAGGIIGATHIAGLTGRDRIITLDMGGTSADVAHYREKHSYSYELTVGSAHILTPALDIHTIAAGGGSICGYDGHRLTVGPESGGADPGPACYGKNGPLTLTDINLLAGRLYPARFRIPLNFSAAEDALDAIQQQIRERSGRTYDKAELLDGFTRIAAEKMAEAIRHISLKRGYDPVDYTFLVFGGAGGQFACDIAETLNMKEVLVPIDAGLLSAYGIGHAELEQFEIRQLLQPYQEAKDSVPDILTEMTTQVRQKFAKAGYDASQVKVRSIRYYLRYTGQESTIEVTDVAYDQVLSAFGKEYQKLVGHKLDRPVEVESIKLIGYIPNQTLLYKSRDSVAYTPEPADHYSPTDLSARPVYRWEALKPGAAIQGPALVINETSTLFIKEGWQGTLDRFRNFILTASGVDKEQEQDYQQEIQLELFTNRFRSIATGMGAILERTAFSVNVKERLDFSCALLDREGYLIVNAPHIPVHLGSLGVCVRSVISRMDLKEGDVAITNHPAFGGSHLPDVTLISPVIAEGTLLGYVANRAHHAEIGGKKPGSMPTDATRLEEEGVVIYPSLLVKGHQALWEQIKKLLTTATYPTRSIHENLADLNGALASLQSGIQALVELASQYGKGKVLHYLEAVKTHACQTLKEKLVQMPDLMYQAEEKLDNGQRLCVRITKSADHLSFNFKGTSAQDKGNLNATPAIVKSVILYVLRLLINKDIPLNEGLMEPVTVEIPPSLLNPEFTEDPTRDPAVVGGNTEVSQRLTDTLLKAFGLVACSQGTMNNLVFGNDRFGYYETICGGTGAGEGFHGADAVHQHMTNTRITDPEIMEVRYPVRLERFSIRNRSGGRGQWEGGDGVERTIRFLEPVALNLLSQHRKVAPYGLQGGEDGKTGTQYVQHPDGSVNQLRGIAGKELSSDDCLIIKTPGGGGYGNPDE